jgi:protein-tyrosine phosphatase
MGNICRSPTALVVTRSLAQQAGLAASLEFDSAGSHGYHVGEAPDLRMQKAAAGRGYDLSGVRARKVTASDLATFDLVLAMDRTNLAYLEGMCHSEDHKGKGVGLFLNYAPSHLEDEVLDPYYGGDGGFERVLDLIEAGARGLLASLRDPATREVDFPGGRA